MNTPAADPPLTLAAAAAAGARIRRLREHATDPDIDAFPQVIVDDDDVNAAVQYLARHRRVRAGVLAAELPDRALLVAYQGQRDLAAHERRLLAVLDAAHALHVPAKAYGEVLGLGSRQAVHTRRARLARRHPRQAPGRAADAAANAAAWLAEHAGAVRRAGEVLVDHREDLLALVPDGAHRAELAAAIDDAGALMTSRQPDQRYTAAVATGYGLLRGARPTDTRLAAALDEAIRLLW